MDGALGYRDDLRDALDRDENLCNGADDCRRAVRMQVARGVDVIKIATTGGVNSRIGAGLGQQMFDDEVQAIVETAHLYGKKVAVHARRGTASRSHSPPVSTRSSTARCSTTSASSCSAGRARTTCRRCRPSTATSSDFAADPNAYSPAVRAKVDWRIGVTGESLRKAVPRGVKIAFGTDAGVSKHGRNADEFELMVKYGMTPAQALAAATVNAADLLGLTAEVGTLEPGKRADLIAVDGDPLGDVTVLKRVPFVMKDGVVFKDERAPRGS